ncbi:MAG TPA: cytochrome c [Desulfobacteria bacterium]|nr:cytochrome c [Desulfobacteria bacterium]
MKNYFFGIATIIVLILVGGAVFIWSGVYNTGADVPHWKITYLLLEEARDRSISHYSRDIKAPSPKGEAALETGFDHFHEMCRLCHGAPGFERREFAEGLYPSPPLLDSDKVQKELGYVELLWVVTNGLKMTGMPSFSKTHTDDQIRDIVAFVEHLPDLGPKGYMEMLRTAEKNAPEKHDHGRDKGTGEAG